MTKTIKNSLIKQWEKIILDYELVKSSAHPYFKSAKEFYNFYNTSAKQVSKYRKRYKEQGGNPDSLLPLKRGPKFGTNRTPKDIERNIVSVYRRLGLNRYELVELFEPVYKHKTPKASTMYLIVKRYQRGLKKKQKEQIKRYEKKYPGELGHIDCYYLPKSTIMPLGVEKAFLCGLTDDCTRITYTEMLSDIKSETVALFTARALSFFYKNYGIRMERILSDNGAEFIGREFRFLLRAFGVKHSRTRPRRPQTNGKIEAFWKIINREFLFPNRFRTKKEFVSNLANYLYLFNNHRRHGGLDYKTPWSKYLKTTKIVTELLD